MESISQEDAFKIRNKIKKFKESLSSFFIKKDEIIDLMTLCAVAHEPLLIVGPPGTAKSDLIIKFRDALGVTQEDYFEYTLTKFTEPSEVLGPIDITSLRTGKYIRRVQGKAPTVKMMFLDEIFKSNSAILNSLLTIINEKKYYQDGKPEKANLKIFFAASNEIPENEELNALKDRFCLKAMTHYVQETHFLELIDVGLNNTKYTNESTRPWCTNELSLEDVEKLNFYLISKLGKVEDRKTALSENMIKKMKSLIKVLQKENNIVVSDRKLIKLYKLIRINSWLRNHDSDGKIENEDLKLFSYLGDSIKDVEILETKIPNIIDVI
jgi:MoxR-like ATPase